MPSKELCTIAGRVESILEFYPKTRSNDRLLIRMYYSVYHGVRTFKEYAEDSKLPTIESIRRCRQKIQEQGRCKAVQNVEDQRREKEVEYAEHFGS